MPAPAGNQFWKARTRHGRKKLFESPEALWEACEEYFEWVEQNPLWGSKTAQFQGSPVDLPEAKMRAMTIGSLCLFLDIDETTWREWRKDKDFSPTVTRADRVMYSQKLTGAAADLLNPNIIARELGLVDRQEQKQIRAIEDMDDDELDRLIAERKSALEKAQRD